MTPYRRVELHVLGVFTWLSPCFLNVFTMAPSGVLLGSLMYLYGTLGCLVNSIMYLQGSLTCVVKKSPRRKI